MKFCSVGAACFMGTDLQINVFFHLNHNNWSLLYLLPPHGHISHVARFCQSPENQLKGYILSQIENNKTPFLSSVSWGYQADRVPGCHVTHRPISAEFERCNEPGGNKGSLITTPKPSCRPQPAPRISCWQPSHSWGRRGEILQPTLLGTISEWTVSDVKTGGTVFLVFWGAVCTYYSGTAKNLSFRTRGLLRLQLQTQSGRERNIQSISAWFFLHACSCSGLHLECMA